MMHFVYLSIIAGLIGLVVIYAVYYNRQSDALETVLAGYDKLDQGFSEVTDAYETDSLQYEDTIEALNEQKADLQRRNDEQAATIDGLRRANDEYFQENVGIRRQLDIAQVIIAEHDLNCLPHIVLKSMEPQEETIPGL